MAQTSPASRLPIAILVTGEPIEAARRRRGGFGNLIRSTVGNCWGGPWLDVDLPAGESLPDPHHVAAVIVTGSPASVVDRAPWTVEGEAYLASVVRVETPVLGICYGHQMLAMALGGAVMKNPNGREIGTVPFEVCQKDAIFAPTGLGTRRANYTHVDSVVELPPGAQRLARTALDPNSAIRFARAAWGVQFHPEVDAAVMRDYVVGRRELIVAEGLDAKAIVDTIDDAPEGAAVLRRFAELVSGHREMASGGD
jgi:GMP synthase (glutamine-hydrolysing)